MALFLPITSVEQRGLQIFDIDHVIHELSQGMTLKAGTIIATGTPAGVGMGMDPPQFLQEIIRKVYIGKRYILVLIIRFIAIRRLTRGKNPGDE